MSCPVLRLSLPTPLCRLFDYLPPQDVDLATLCPGLRVLVPFQSRELVGVLIDIVPESSVARTKLKQALQILDTTPILSQDVYALCHFAANYYHYALGEIFSMALPPLLRKGRALIKSVLAAPVNNQQQTLPVLNEAQQKAVSAIDALHGQFGVILVDGVTGSGKTEVYMRAMEKVLQSGKQILMLVPEISLTPQTITQFQQRFHVPIAMLHSHLTPRARLQTWQAVHQGDIAILIGTRSAIFVSFKQLGLIVVDEEHDPSFKQQDHLRYHARDLAVVRAQHNHIPVVLGSATPSLETLANVERQSYQHVVLAKRAGLAHLPTFTVIDISVEKMQAGLSTSLLQAMTSHLAAHSQVMLFLNRRGYAPALYCTHCAKTMECHRCDARMVYHQQPPRLHCHHCDSKMRVPSHCMQCQHDTLQPIGIGTQRIEDFLVQQFKGIPIIRIDRDSTQRKGSLENLLQQINTQPQAILLGTQMLAKGHHFPHVTLVGIVDADSGLFSADFRASEQMGQLLMQVSGRAGRAEQPGTVIIQTRQPQYPLLQKLLKEGYASYAQHLLIERRAIQLPPYHFMALLHAFGKQEKTVIAFLTAVKQTLESYHCAITLTGPLPALMPKRKGLYCQQLLFKSKKRAFLHQTLAQTNNIIEKMKDYKNVKWALDIDPYDR